MNENHFRDDEINRLHFLILLFSAHISYGKGKYLNRTGFFYKICQEFIYIKAKGFHP